MPGIDTSAAEVTHISANGIWVLIDEDEFPLPYADFPWFRNSTVDQILTVERPTADHLYWPKLDIDLALASIKNPACIHAKNENLQLESRQKPEAGSGAWRFVCKNRV